MVATRTAAALLAVALSASGCRRGRPVPVPNPGATAGRCRLARGRDRAATAVLRDGADRASVEVRGDPCARTYVLSTTARLRDGRPPNPRTIRERPGGPILRTRHHLFDALYALALEEVGDDSVAEIRDDAFDDGRPLECPAGGCFQTGRLWTYVWTRDTSYSVDLALAALDPLRARNSLELKLSERRGGGDLQVVQDTGSGGSYPISTDRVAWAFGARALLDQLDGRERAAFARRAYRALKNTIEHDRAVVFDPADGLYRGETSFLDWREQTYPAWTAEDTAPIGMSEALSTNVAHLVAIELCARLAHELGEKERARRYRGWARGLRRAIATRFYLPETSELASFSLAPFDPSPARRLDLLGISLAVLEGIGTEEQARAAVARYPHLPKGPPVVWPQQPEPPIYHNRAIWPFVTAYELRAARRVGNDAAVNRGVASLVRAAALNLSNMENLEAVTGLAWVKDGARSGPVVDSQRQLWSVAGYLSMVHDVLFGMEVSGEGIRFRPYVTRELRNRMFAGAETLVLDDLPYRGRRIDVVMELPPPSEELAGAYRIGRVRLDGAPIGSRYVRPEELGDDSVIEVTLEPGPPRPASLAVLGDLSDPRVLFGPPAPAIPATERTPKGLRLALDVPESDRARVVLDLFRDGTPLAVGLPGTRRVFVDTGAGNGSASHCYTVAARDPRSKNISQRSRPVCVFGVGDANREIIAAGDQPRWLRAGGSLSFGTFRARMTGPHLVRAIAANGAGPINTGVTCGVFHLTVTDTETGAPAGDGYLAVPHTGEGAWNRFLPSATARVNLRRGRSYRISLDARDPRAVNMSAFAHFERYTGGAGGAGGAENRARIRSIEILWGLAAPK